MRDVVSTFTIRYFGLGQHFLLSRPIVGRYVAVVELRTAGDNYTFIGRGVKKQVWERAGARL